MKEVVNEGGQCHLARMPSPTENQIAICKKTREPCRVAEKLANQGLQRIEESPCAIRGNLEGKGWTHVFVQPIGEIHYPYIGKVKAY